MRRRWWALMRVPLWQLGRAPGSERSVQAAHHLRLRLGELPRSLVFEADDRRACRYAGLERARVGGTCRVVVRASDNVAPIIMQKAMLVQDGASTVETRARRGARRRPGGDGADKASRILVRLLDHRTPLYDENCVSVARLLTRSEIDHFADLFYRMAQGGGPLQLARARQQRRRRLLPAEAALQGNAHAVACFSASLHGRGHSPSALAGGVAPRAHRQRAARARASGRRRPHVNFGGIFRNSYDYTQRLPWYTAVMMIGAGRPAGDTAPQLTQIDWGWMRPCAPSPSLA